jgi:hypothetical protein
MTPRSPQTVHCQSIVPGDVSSAASCAPQRLRCEGLAHRSGTSRALPRGMHDPASMTRGRAEALQHGHERHDALGQVRGDIRHSLVAAARAKAATLAAQRHEALELAICAAEPREAVREHAALQEGLQFLLDELRRAGAVLRLRGAVQEGREVLPQDAVQHARFGIATRIGRARVGAAVKMGAA